MLFSYAQAFESGRHTPRWFHRGVDGRPRTPTGAVSAPTFVLAATFGQLTEATHGTIANTRAGNPEPFFGFGKLTTTMAPASGT